MLPPFQGWADLLPELLCRIGDHTDDLKSYAIARCVCTAWRRALAPPSPTLLLMAAPAVGGDPDARWWCRPYALSLRTPRRPLALPAARAIAAESRCVGASDDGWLALAVDCCQSVAVSLVNPVAAGAAEIRLPPLVYMTHQWLSVSKVAQAPRPARDDFGAAAMCDANTVAYVTAGATEWVVMEPLRLAGWDYLTDVLYDADGNKVYCLSQRGDVHVLRLPERRRPPTANVDELELSLLRPAQPPAESECTTDLRPSRWQHRRNLPMTHGEHARTRIAQTFLPDLNMSLMDAETTVIPDLNIPLMNDAEPFIPSYKTTPPDDKSHNNESATIEPLLSDANLPFNPAFVFAPPYNTVSSFTNAKNLVLCEGNLYQVWRNKSCAVTLNLPTVGQRRRVAENEILVFRYYPHRQPSWDVVKNLGGHSFVGRNNAVSMYAKGVPGLRGNCVYWIGGRGRDQGMVFDMESGRSTPCSGFLPGHPHRTICWYLRM